MLETKSRLSTGDVIQRWVFPEYVIAIITSIVAAPRIMRKFLTPSTVDARNVNSGEIVHASFVNFVDLENKVGGTTERSQTSNYIHHSSGSRLSACSANFFAPSDAFFNSD